MGEKSTILIALTLILFATTFVASQEHSIDISGLNAEKYNPGEEVTFKIILLEDGKETQEEVTYQIADALEKTKIEGETNSNEETSIKIEDDFLSGRWIITADYKDIHVTRYFLINENSEVKFLIEEDRLIIRNIGNTPYKKTIHITIGTNTNSYAQNIRVGEEKILKLISPDGTYDIEVTDDDGASIKKENIQLFGTGNVVGAIDEGLIGYTGFAGTENPEDIENRAVSLKKLPLSLIFIAAIGILAFLVIIERRLSKKKASA